MPTVESLGTNYNSDTKERSRSRSNDKVIDNNGMGIMQKKEKEDAGGDSQVIEEVSQSMGKVSIIPEE